MNIDLEQLKQFEKIKKVALLKMLSKKAYERLGRIRAVKPELAMQIELYLLQLSQSGELKNAITDEQLKQILDKLSEKKEFKIRRI